MDRLGAYAQKTGGFALVAFGFFQGIKNQSFAHGAEVSLHGKSFLHNRQLPLRLFIMGLM